MAVVSRCEGAEETGQLAQNTSDLPDKNASYWFQWEMLSFGPSIFSGPKKMDGLLALGVVGE